MVDVRPDPTELAGRLLTDPAFRRETLARLEEPNVHTPRSSGVSVVVPTYRGAHRIAATLVSLAEQDLDPALFEVVVVVNGDDDGTIDLLARVRAEHPRLEVRVVRTARASAGMARNIGVAAAHKDWLTFVDDDDRVEPAYLSSLLAVARPHVVVTAPLADVHPDGSIDETTAASERLRALEEHPTGVPLAEVAMILGLNACKLVSRALATRLWYDTDLRSGEDVAFWAGLLTERLTAVPARGDGPRRYLRTVRDNSVSRQDHDLDFAVRDRLEVIRRLESIDVLPANRNALAQLITGQASFVTRYLQANPEQRSTVRSVVEASGVVRFPWHVLNKNTAKDLAIVYCFAPFLDPSGVVAAKAIAERGRVVDVILADMSEVRPRDASVDALARYWIDHRFIVPTKPAFTSWSWICDFARKAATRARRWAETKESGYETLYTRALWAGGHVAGALVKLEYPATVWTAEFSDPLARGIDATKRPGVLTENEETSVLRAAVEARGFTVPEDATLFEFVELVTYALADDLVFTNDNQRDYMLSLVDPRLAEHAAAKARVRPHPSPVATAYDEVATRYTVPDGVVNLAYFGSFYGNRTLREVLDGLADLDGDVRSRMRLHVFCNKPEEFRELVGSHGLTDVVYVNPYLDYMEFLNASTRFDVLIVQDAETAGTFARNPFLPSKYSDYRGSGAKVWGVVEEGSSLSAMPLDFVSSVGDPASARAALHTIAELGPRGLIQEEAAHGLSL